MMKIGRSRKVCSVPPAWDGSCPNCRRGADGADGFVWCDCDQDAELAKRCREKDLALQLVVAVLRNEMERAKRAEAELDRLIAEIRSVSDTCDGRTDEGAYVLASWIRDQLREIADRGGGGEP